MNPKTLSGRIIPRARCAVALCSVAGVIASIGLSDAEAADPRGRAAVQSTVSREYARTRLPDGTFQQETYAFGNGGCSAGAMRDESIDGLPFLAVVAELIQPLARRGYVSSKDPQATQLLIMVHWGTTLSPSDTGLMPASGTSTAIGPMRAPPAESAGGTAVPTVSEGFALASTQVLGGADTSMMDFYNRIRDRITWRNATILGYSDALRSFDRLGQRAILRVNYDEIVGEIEDARYFVILVAYDFQKAWKSRELEVLWTTRFSMRTRGNRFDAQLPVLAQHASRYFGADSDGLVRGYLPPTGEVRIEPSEVIGTE